MFYIRERGDLLFHEKDPYPEPDFRVKPRREYAKICLYFIYFSTDFKARHLRKHIIIFIIFAHFLVPYRYSICIVYSYKEAAVFW